MSYTARVCNNTRRPTCQQMQVCARMSVTIDPIGGVTQLTICSDKCRILRAKCMCTVSAMHTHVGLQTPGSHRADPKISNRAVITPLF